MIKYMIVHVYDCTYMTSMMFVYDCVYMSFEGHMITVYDHMCVLAYDPTYDRHIQSYTVSPCDEYI